MLDGLEVRCASATYLGERGVLLCAGWPKEKGQALAHSWGHQQCRQQHAC